MAVVARRLVLRERVRGWMTVDLVAEAVVSRNLESPLRVVQKGSRRRLRTELVGGSLTVRGRMRGL